MKKVLIFFACFVVLLALAGGGLFWYYNNTIKEATYSSKGGSKSKDGSNSDDVITLVIEKGTTSKQIVDMIYNSGLIKNKYVGYAYLKLHSGINLQAGVYEVRTSMNFEEIMDYISAGNVVDNSISVTFVEGKRLVNYVKQISTEFGYSEEEILEKISDREYIEKLIDKYWFLTDDILNDKLYYALEGYLYPSTYKFAKDASIEDIISKMLDAMGATLKNYEAEINESKYSVHEILTLSSVIQNEGKTSDFRDISSVFNNRLVVGMKLESCATSYYGARKEFTAMGIASDALISANNPYNTYIVNSLPIGPISSPSKLALEAALKPSETEYYFFLSDNEGVSYFFKTYAEHQSKQAELVSLGKWAR